MENEHVLSGLIRKRQEVAAELEAAQGRIKQLAFDLGALDTTIRLFKPGLDLTATTVQRSPHRHVSHRGEATRLVLTVLREASEPLTNREVTARVMQARNINPDDKALATAMRKRTAANLFGLKLRKVVVGAVGKDDQMRWRVAS